MKLHATLIVAALALTSAISQAGPRHPFGTGELPEVLKPFDVDGDGRLSVEERQAFEQAVKDGLVTRPTRPTPPTGTPPPRPANPFDTNGDGKLDAAEIAAAQAAIAERIKAQRTERFNALDTDDSGDLSAEELGAIPRITAEQVTALITRLDKDASGTVSLEEFLASFGPRPRPRPAGGTSVPPTTEPTGPIRR